MSDVKITIRDVAKHAGVSAATVSRVLNKPDMVDPETKARVRQAMETLNFQPNAIARGLSSQRMDTIGVVVPGINDLFFDELYRGIERETRHNNMKVLLFDTQHDRHRAQEGFVFLKQHQVGGIIFTSRLVDENYDPVISRLGIPIVLALTEATGKTPLPAYKVDDVKAVFDAVSYLVSRGHRRIGMISGELLGDRTSELRLQGFKAGLSHYGIPYREGIVEAGDYRFEGGYTAMRKLLERQEENRLTAIFAASDEMAIGAMRCLYDNGLRVPDDISVVGFDDLSVARMVMPSLTTVAQPFVTIGEQVVRCLLQMIHSRGEYSPTGTYYLPHTLVERESVRAIDADN
jgi:LacI family transcriptional regulator